MYIIPLFNILIVYTKPVATKLQLFLPSIDLFP